MANYLTRLIDEQATSFGEAIDKIIGRAHHPTEENRELAEELYKTKLQTRNEEVEASFPEAAGDRGQARIMEQQTLKSREVGKLNKYIHPILAIIIITFTLMIYLSLLVFKQQITNSGSKDIIIYILGALTTISTQVVAYYFGSSQGSREKQESIKNLTNHIISNADT